MEEEKDVIISICRYMYENWISKAKSQREFASKCDIEESTVRRIKNVALGTTKTNYNISLNTIAKICIRQDISLEEFFKNIKK